MPRPLALVLAFASSALASCGPSQPQPGVAKAPEVGDADREQATCKVAKDPLNPLVVEWPGTSKASLDSASQKGVVVVSYVGCVLKVLTSCQAGGSYDFRGITPVRDKVTIENETDLYARLPLGVASLKADLASAGRLDLEYVAVGQRETAKPPVSLQGECAGATHYVRSIMVGAYGLDAIGKASAGSAVDVAGKGAGAKHEESIRHLRGSGDVGGCSSGGDKAKSECGAVLQLGLAPLMVGGGGAVTAAGFGAGLGAMMVVPTVQQITTLPGASTSLAAADVALLEALQEAKRADKSSAAMTKKAAAWDKLARYEGVNPYRELAERRRDEWERAAEAEARRSEQVAKVCAQYQDDFAKLTRLLELDSDVVSLKQKDAYRNELAEVYAPYMDAVEECVRGLRAEAAREAKARTAAAAVENPAFDEGHGDFARARVHDLRRLYAPGTRVLVFYAAGTPGGVCSGGPTTFFASADGTTWQRLGEHANETRSGRDDTIHLVGATVRQAFRYIKVETPGCYTDYSGASVGLSTPEVKARARPNRKWAE